MRGQFFLAAVLLVALVAAPGVRARAAERVTLSNGFVQVCNHHAQVEGRIRLYTTTREDSYIDFAPEEIVSVETVPDPPQPPSSATEAGTTPAGTTGATDAQLSPADLREMLVKAGAEHNLDVDLIASVVKAESNGNARAVSRAGARGLMQLMPGTAALLGVEDSFEPKQNVRGGSAYLNFLLTRYHENLTLAVAAYNAGPEAVDRYGGIPPYRETQAYVARVIHEFNRRVKAREAQARQVVAQSPVALSPADHSPADHSPADLPPSSQSPSGDSPASEAATGEAPDAPAVEDKPSR